MKYCLRITLLAISYMFFLHLPLVAQDSGGLYNRVVHFPDKFFRKVDEKSADISSRLVKQTDKYLSRLAKQERKLRDALSKKDSLAASHLFDDAQKQYAALQTGMNSVTTATPGLQHTYLSHLDSLKTALGFLNQAKGVLKGSPEEQSKLKDATGSLDKLQDKFTQAEEVKKFVAQRKLLLQGNNSVNTTLRCLTCAAIFALFD